MNRQALDNGQWFDLDAATSFDEATRWDGRNHVSRATGDQFLHERLYRTKSGKWVLNAWSQWQGSRETWEIIGDAGAACWLVQNEHEAHEACAKEYAALDLDASVHEAQS